MCAERYDEHVSFCFADGTPLGEVAMEPTPPPVPRRTPSVIPRADDPLPAPRPLELAPALPPAPPASVWWVPLAAAVVLAGWVAAAWGFR